MKLVLKPFLLLVTLLLFNCKEDIPLEYKYTTAENYLNCEFEQEQLIKEALYSFENDLRLHYDWDNRNPYLSYSQLIYRAIDKNIDFKEISSPHTVLVFEKLKAIDALWNAKKLNYNDDFVKCLLDNVKNEETKKIFNSLITTNTFDIRYFGPTLIRRYTEMVEDKHLSTFVALDIFYSGLFDVDTDIIKEKVLNKYGAYEFPKKKN